MSSTGESGSDTSEESEYQIGESVCTQFEDVPQVVAQLVEIDEEGKEGEEDKDKSDDVETKAAVQEFLNDQHQAMQEQQKEEEEEKKKYIEKNKKSYINRILTVKVT